MAIERFIRTVRVYNPQTKQIQNVTVALAIDIDAVANVMGAQAMRNKTVVSKQLSGRIVCSVREIEVPTKPLYDAELICDVERVRAKLFD